MTTFDDIYNFFQKQEDGYKKADNAGFKIYCGINERYNKDWLGWEYVKTWVATMGGDNNAETHKSNDSNLIKMVREFFDEKYYKKYKLNEINDIGIVGQLFEMAVAKIIQPVCDTVFGTKNMNEIINLSNETPDYYMGKLINSRSRYYHTIINNMPYKREYVIKMDKRIADLATLTGASGYANISEYDMEYYFNDNT
jgi:hypothetical protein